MPRHDALHLYQPAIGPAARFFACYPPHKRPSLSDIQELADKGRLYTTDDDVILLVRNPTQPPTRSDKPNSVGRAACLQSDEPVRIYVPLLMRPWIVQACHSTASCHLGTTLTLRMPERFYWWIGMNVCTRWWLHHCLNCQARRTPRLTVRWPIISMPLPEGPGIAVSVDCFGPLPVTPRGSTYILLFTDRSSRRADMFPVTAAEFHRGGYSQHPCEPIHPPCRGARALYSRTTACSSAPSFRKLFISCWACASLLQAPFIPTVTVALSG